MEPYLTSVTHTEPLSGQVQADFEINSSYESADARQSALEKLGRSLKATGCRLWKSGIPIYLYVPKNDAPPYLVLADIRIMLAEGCHPARPGYTIWISGAAGDTCIAGWAGEAEVRTTLNLLAAYNPDKYRLHQRS